MCLNVDNYINNPQQYLTETCGFSNRLIYWINNILKWVKYIVPALLIVLSILDFIKAMSSDKDDELSKAKKRIKK